MNTPTDSAAPALHLRKAGNGRKVLLFASAGDIFGIPIARIKEVIEYGGVTRVPMTPPHLRGVVNLRGSVVPVIDLAARLGRPPAEAGRRTCIVVLEVDDGDEVLDVGVVVDGVNEVVDLDPAALQPAPSFGASIRDEFIAGMADVADRFVVLLDETTTFAVDELAAVHAAVRAVA